MAADLHIHVVTPEVTHKVLSTFFSHSLGSKYCNLFHGNISREEDDNAYETIANTPSVWVGEISWLKASLFEDSETFIPNMVAQVSEIVGEDLPIIDDELIEKINKAFDAENATSYSLASRQKVIEFLEQHKGEKVFTVSW